MHADRVDKGERSDRSRTPKPKKGGKAKGSQAKGKGKGKGKAPLFTDLLRNHKDKFVLKREGQEVPDHPDVCQKVTRADQHQSLSRERPLCPVQSSPARSVSAWSSKPLLVISSCQQVVTELSQAFQCQPSAFRQEFASELLHFSLLTPHAGVLPFGGFSMLLEEITRGSFCGLIAIPPASTWSRARNSGVPGPPPLRSVSKVSLQSSWIRSKNTIRHSSSVLWLWTSGVKVYHCAHSSSLHQKTEVGRFTQDQHRFGSLQRLWRSPNVLVKQFEAAHSRASYESRILHVRSPSSQISINSGPVSFKAGQGYGRKETSCNTLALSLTVVLVVSSIGNYLELDKKESLRQGCLHCSWTKVLVTASKTLRDGVNSRRKVFRTLEAKSKPGWSTQGLPGSAACQSRRTVRWTRTRSLFIRPSRLPEGLPLTSLHLLSLPLKDRRRCVHYLLWALRRASWM